MNGRFDNDEGFDQPVYQEEIENPKKVIIISCEGKNTEPEYFRTIKSKLKDDILSLVEIEIVPKEENKSEPINVLNSLEDYVEKYDFKKNFDSLWLVCDREHISNKNRIKSLKETRVKCEERGYSLILSNPLFEFWLLLHVADINQYNH